jgi:hypothetical protein
VAVWLGEVDEVELCVLAPRIFKYPNAVFGMKLLAEAFFVLRSKLFVL